MLYLPGRSRRTHGRAHLAGRTCREATGQLHSGPKLQQHLVQADPAGLLPQVGRDDERQAAHKALRDLPGRIALRTAQHSQIVSSPRRFGVDDERQAAHEALRDLPGRMALRINRPISHTSPAMCWACPRRHWFLSLHDPCPELPVTSCAAVSVVSPAHGIAVTFLNDERQAAHKAVGDLPGRIALRIQHYGALHAYAGNELLRSGSGLCCLWDLASGELARPKPYPP